MSGLFAGPLRMADIGPQVALSLREDFVALADFRPQELHVTEVHGLVDEDAGAGGRRSARCAQVHQQPCAGALKPVP
ncbi:hypothetical protein [Streptomyces sp. NPDC048473]|uniref:hypothetical protein n=1 Tax=unclassified Streptomyces TaxID=2593676 RepID=UPI0037195966